MATKTQIYKEVLREYDALRTRKAAELRERKESLYARFPRLAEIEETLSMVGVSTAKLVLLHPEEREKAMTEMKQKQQVLQDERMALLAKNCLSPSLLKLEYACEKCRDTGYIEGTPCTCMRRRLMDRLYDQSNVRDVIKLENFDTFDLRLFDTEVVPAEGISPKENAQRNLKKAMEFAEHPPALRRRRQRENLSVQLYCQRGAGAWKNGALSDGRAAFQAAGGYALSQ